MGRAGREVAIADRFLQATTDVAAPADWAQLAGKAATLRNEAQRLVVARTLIDRLIAPAQEARHSHLIDVDGTRGGLELGL